MSCYSRGCNQPHKQAELMPGDTIKCHDADDAAQVHEDLCRGGGMRRNSSMRWTA